jgi:hypothetical protein
MIPLSQLNSTLSCKHFGYQDIPCQAHAAPRAHLSIYGMLTVPNRTHNRRMLHHVRTALAPIVGKVLGLGVDEEMGHRPHDGNKFRGTETVFSGAASSTFGGSTGGGGGGARDWRNSTGYESMYIACFRTLTVAHTQMHSHTRKRQNTLANSQCKDKMHHRLNPDSPPPLPPPPSLRDKTIIELSPLSPPNPCSHDRLEDDHKQRHVWRVRVTDSLPRRISAPTT